MKKIFSKTKELIFSQQGGIFSSAMILSGMILLSRIFGFFRYRILAGYFNKEQLDIFFASFRIPDLLFEILITGALTSSLIPIYVKYQKDKENLGKTISSIINLFLIGMTLCVIILFFLMDYIIPLITPGFSPDKIQLVIYYSKILLITQLPFLIFGNLLTGIAQAQKTFFITAVAPVLYNVAVIVITPFLAGSLFLLAPVIGVVVGAIIFVLIQLPIIDRAGFTYSAVINYSSGVKEFFNMIGPRIITVIISQIDATIDLTLTTLLGPGSYTVFYFAQHLQLLPVSVIGIAFGQASLPYLSELYENKKMTELLQIILDSVLNILFLAIPIAGYFIFARTPLVRLFFGGERFDWDATIQTAYSLSYFALSLPLHTIYYLLARCFYAMMDTVTPFIVSLLTIGFNTILSIIFVLMFHLPVWALSLSFSLSITFQVAILFFLLMQRFGKNSIGWFWKDTGKIILATLISTPLAYVSIKAMDLLLLDTTRTINIFIILAVSSVIYVFSYVLIAWFLTIKQLYLITKLLLKVKEFQKKVIELYVSYE